VYEQNREADLPTLMSELLPDNIKPLSQPLSIGIYGNKVIFKVYHTFADGRFAMLMIPQILLAALDEAAFNALPPIKLGFSLPTWRIVWQTPQQGIEVFYTWLKTFFGTYEEYKGTTTNPRLPRAKPVQSGTPMSVACHIIDLKVIDLLD